MPPSGAALGSAPRDRRCVAFLQEKGGSKDVRMCRKEAVSGRHAGRVLPETAGQELEEGGAAPAQGPGDFAGPGAANDADMALFGHFLHDVGKGPEVFHPGGQDFFALGLQLLVADAAQEPQQGDIAAGIGQEVGIHIANGAHNGPCELVFGEADAGEVGGNAVIGPEGGLHIGIPVA